MKQLSPSGRDNFVAVVSMLILATLSVFLRFFARRSAGVSLAWEDGLIVLALLFMIAYAGMMIQYIAAGPGPARFNFPEITATNVQWAKALLRVTYVVSLLYVVVITLAKLSMLALYHRIFYISESFLRWNQITAGLCIIWFMISIFMFGFQCQPVSMYWEVLGSKESCLPAGELWLGLEITNLFLDVMILSLPVVKVYKMKLPTVRKWAVGGIFLLGGLVCVASIIKLTFIWRPARTEAMNLSGMIVWSSVHLGLAIVCASLPTYTPLLRMTLKWLGLRTQNSNNAHDNNRPNSRRPTLLRKESDTNNITMSPYCRMDDPVTTRTEISGGRHEAYPMHNLEL